MHGLRDSARLHTVQNEVIDTEKIIADTTIKTVVLIVKTPTKSEASSGFER